MRWTLLQPCRAISIHAAREGGDLDDVAGFQRTGDISIHAAREGGDVVPLGTGTLSLYISIHAAREGGDEALFMRSKSKGNFNPRRP